MSTSTRKKEKVEKHEEEDNGFTRQLYSMNDRRNYVKYWVKYGEEEDEDVFK